MAVAQDPLAAAQAPLAGAQIPTIGTQDGEKSKVDWWQIAMFLFALLCFTGAAILWAHSGQTP